MGDLTVQALIMLRSQLRSKIDVLQALLPFDEPMDYARNKRRLRSYQLQLENVERRLGELGHVTT